VAYWEAPHGAETATGADRLGACEELFKAVEDLLPRLMAEGLGFVSTDVVELRRRLG
jgi:4-alpha-glucanotransferase